MVLARDAQSFTAIAAIAFFKSLSFSLSTSTFATFRNQRGLDWQRTRSGAQRSRSAAMLASALAQPVWGEPEHVLTDAFQGNQQPGRLWVGSMTFNDHTKNKKATPLHLCNRHRICPDPTPNAVPPLLLQLQTVLQLARQTPLHHPYCRHSITILRIWMDLYPVVALGRLVILMFLALSLGVIGRTWLLAELQTLGPTSS